MDLYSPVTTAYAKSDNAFTGKIKKVTISREVRCSQGGRRRDSPCA